MVSQRTNIFYWAFLSMRHMEVNFGICQIIENDEKFVSF